LPRSAAFNAATQQGGTPMLELPLSAGDDYELCFTIPGASLPLLTAAQADFSCDCTRIGTVERETGIRCYTADGQRYTLSGRGYEHFGVSPHG